MRVLFIFSIIYFIIGVLAIIIGIKNSNALLTAMGAVCWCGMNFFELIMMKHDSKGRQHE